MNLANQPELLKPNDNIGCNPRIIARALRDLVDIPIHVNVNDMEIAEDAQIATFHFVKQKLYKLLSKDAAPMAKYIKRVGED